MHSSDKCLRTRVGQTLSSVNPAISAIVSQLLSKRNCSCSPPWQWEMPAVGKRRKKYAVAASVSRVWRVSPCLVTGTGQDAITSSARSRNLYLEAAKTTVRIGRGVIVGRVRSADIFADGREGFDLLLPVSRAIEFSAGVRRKILEGVVQTRGPAPHPGWRLHKSECLRSRRPGRRHRGRSHLRCRGHWRTLRWLCGRAPGGIPQGQQYRVKQRRVVARRNVAQARPGRDVILCQRSGAKKIAAESVNGHRIRGRRAAW